MLYDDKYNIQSDNPFPDDEDGSMKIKTRNHIKNNPDDFVFYDWKENAHSRDVLEIDSENKQYVVFGRNLASIQNVSEVANFGNVIKGFFNQNNGHFHFSNELMNWASAGGNFAVQEQPQFDEVSADESYDFDEEADEGNGVDYFDGGEGKIEITTYNFGSDTALTFEEVCKLCINQARKQLVSSRSKSISIEKIEADRKNELIDEILKLYEIGEIKIMDKRDLTKLSISELEELRKRVEIKFDSCKTREMIHIWLDTGSLIYETVFPDGLPLGKGRHLRVNGVGKEIDKTILNPTTVSGQAARRILEKHHFHVSDEAMVFSKLANIISKNAEIVHEGDEIDEEEEEELSESYDTSSDVLGSVSD